MQLKRATETLPQYFKRIHRDCLLHAKTHRNHPRYGYWIRSAETCRHEYAEAIKRSKK